MNDRLPCLTTHLEDLPDEIFLTIFAYIPVETLYYGFRHINQRIDSILASVRLSTRVEVSDDRDPSLLAAIQHFRSQTISLHIALWCAQLDLKEFRRLRSLHIVRPTFVQLMDIQPEHLPDLRCLSVKFATPLKYDYIDDFYRLLLSKRFPQLRSVRQDGADLRLEHYVVENAHLRSLFIGSCELQHWPDLLKALPALCHFTTTMFYITPPIAVFISFQHTALRYLNVVFDEYDYPVSDLETVLCFTPALRHLVVRCRHVLASIDFAGLSDIFAERTPHLKHFQCRFNIGAQNNGPMANIDHVRQISSLFATLQYKRHMQYRRLCTVATEPMIDEYRSD